MVTKCPQCKSRLEKVKFDIGYGIDVNSLHCKRCGFNITENNKLKSAISSLKDHMSKQIKIIKIGTGLGVRFPNEIVKSMNLKKGEEVELRPDDEGIRIVV